SLEPSRARGSARGPTRRRLEPPLDEAREARDGGERVAVHLVALDLDTEFFLERHHQLEGVDRVEAQPFTEEGLAVLDRIRVGAVQVEAVDDETLDPLAKGRRHADFCHAKKVLEEEGAVPPPEPAPPTCAHANHGPGNRWHGLGRRDPDRTARPAREQTGPGGKIRTGAAGAPGGGPRGPVQVPDLLEFPAFQYGQRPDPHLVRAARRARTPGGPRRVADAARRPRLGGRARPRRRPAPGRPAGPPRRADRF